MAKTKINGKVTQTNKIIVSQRSRANQGALRPSSSSSSSSSSSAAPPPSSNESDEEREGTYESHQKKVTQAQLMIAKRERQIKALTDKIKHTARTQNQKHFLQFLRVLASQYKQIAGKNRQVASVEEVSENKRAFDKLIWFSGLGEVPDPEEEEQKGEGILKDAWTHVRDKIIPHIKNFLFPSKSRGTEVRAPGSYIGNPDTNQYGNVAPIHHVKEDNDLMRRRPYIHLGNAESYQDPPKMAPPPDKRKKEDEDLMRRGPYIHLGSAESYKDPPKMIPKPSYVHKGHSQLFKDPPKITPGGPYIHIGNAPMHEEPPKDIPPPLPPFPAEKFPPQLPPFPAEKFPPPLLPFDREKWQRQVLGKQSEADIPPKIPNHEEAAPISRFSFPDPTGAPPAYTGVYMKQRLIRSINEASASEDSSRDSVRGDKKVSSDNFMLDSMRKRRAVIEDEPDEEGGGLSHFKRRCRIRFH
jgi:hypothetical protein